MNSAMHRMCFVVVVVVILIIVDQIIFSTGKFGVRNDEKANERSGETCMVRKVKYDQTNAYTFRSSQQHTERSSQSSLLID